MHLEPKKLMRTLQIIISKLFCIERVVKAVTVMQVPKQVPKEELFKNEKNVLQQVPKVELFKNLNLDT